MEDVRIVHDRQDNLKLMLSIVSTLCLVVLVPLNAWALNTIVQLQSRVTSVETQMLDFKSAGPRYTTNDANRDFGVVTKLLEAQGKVIDDHEGRIRLIERERR